MDLFVNFHNPNYRIINKEIKKKTGIIQTLSSCLQVRIQRFLSRLFTAKGLEAAVAPQMNLLQSHDDGPVGRLSASPED